MIGDINEGKQVQVVIIKEKLDLINKIKYLIPNYNMWRS